MLPDDSDYTNYDALLRQVTNRQTGAVEYVYYLTPGTGIINPRKTIWFNFERGDPWFEDDSEAEIFRTATRLKRNIAVRFITLADAQGFLERLEPAATGRSAVH